jgi:hypothetical protein
MECFEFWTVFFFDELVALALTSSDIWFRILRHIVGTKEVRAWAVLGGPPLSVLTNHMNAQTSLCDWIEVSLHYHVSMLQSLPIRSLATLGRRTITSDSNISRNGVVIHETFAPNLSKKPSRSGQNLSFRYIRLERSHRAKEASLKELEVASDSVPSTTRPQPFNKKSVELFHGFEIPEEPNPPGDNGGLIF